MIEFQIIQQAYIVLENFPLMKILDSKYTVHCKYSNMYIDTKSSNHINNYSYFWS